MIPSGASRMKILLIQPPFEDFYATPIRLYPLGLLYTASALRDAGCEVRVLDCLSPLRKRPKPVPREMAYLEPYLREPLFFKGYHRFGLSEEEIIRRIREFGPEAIGISSQFTAYYQSVEELARRIKREFGLPIFVGGHHATAFPEEIKRRTPEIDHVFAGPAEECLPDVLKALGIPRNESGGDWTLTRPAHDLVPAELYKIGQRNYLSLIGGRGCPLRCDFCGVHSMFGRTIRYRPVEGVLDEMRAAYLHRRVRVFNFEDDNLSFDRPWFLELLKAIKEDKTLENIELTAMNGLCSMTLDENLLPDMAAAGFRELNLSYVTRSGEIKERYHRPVEKEDFERLIRAARRQGFFVTVYVIMGLPGQSVEEIRAGMEYLWSLGVLVGPSVFYIPPGSPLYDRLHLPADIRNNWNLYRSSAFAVETETLDRARLIDLFLYARRKNLENRNEMR